MRKILLLLVCVSMALGVNAQIRYGVKLGGTLSSLTMKNDGVKVDLFKPGVGLKFGGVLEYSFSNSLALQPELLYVFNNAGTKDIEGVEETFGINPKWAYQSIQLPINLKYKMGIENLKFYVTAGPYLGYIVSAKMKAKISGLSTSIDLFNEDVSEGLQLRHFDFGLGVGFGVEISKIAVGVGYQYGIANLTSADQGSLKLGTFNLSAGYFF